MHVPFACLPAGSRTGVPFEVSKMEKYYTRYTSLAEDEARRVGMNGGGEWARCEMLDMIRWNSLFKFKCATV